MEVALVRWPAEASRRDALLAAGAPVLLLVEAGAPPVEIGPVEDWIRIPSTDADIEARVRGIKVRVETAGIPDPHFGSDGLPVLDEGGVLRFGSRWVSISPLESRLVDALLERPGAVIPRQILTEAVWPDDRSRVDGPGRNALDIQVLRLRRRLHEVGLTVRTVRSRGYILDLIDRPPEVRS
jgi:DNA-binding response OmpR family regulator